MEQQLTSYMNHLSAEKNASQYTLRNYRREFLDTISPEDFASGG